MTEQLPVGMAYSGVMFGLYALGELKKCLTPADLRSPNASAKKNESLPAVIASQAAGEGAEAGTLPIPDRLNCLRLDFLVCSLPPRAP